jgi:hypothetical protein
MVASEAYGAVRESRECDLLFNNQEPVTAGYMQIYGESVEW